MEHTMTTTHTRKKFLTATVAAAIATMAAPALLFLSAGTAQAVIHHLPTPRTCAGCEGFNPQPDPPGDPDPDNKVGLGGPDTKVGVGTPGGAPSLNPGDTVGIIIIGG
jgi:hypothetical protein